MSEMKKSLPKDDPEGVSLWRSLLAGAALGLLAGGLELFGQLMLGATWGTKSLYELCNLLSILTPIIATICLIAGVLGSIRWENARRLVAGSFALLLVFMVVAGFSSTIRRQSLARVCERLRPVVDAVKHHVRDHGAPPEDLSTLVPAPLPALPQPSGVLTHMHLDNRRYPAPWALVVRLPGAPLQDKSLVYLSNENYPTRRYGGGSGLAGLDGLGRIGDWAILTTTD